jgi:hypothetical protein
MSALASGARRLPLHHVTIRVPWRWNSRGRTTSWASRSRSAAPAMRSCRGPSSGASTATTLAPRRRPKRGRFSRPFVRASWGWTRSIG